nr:DDE-type integrase/transposase/recombinase [Aneurinibacillus terranovensis]
MHGAFYPTLDSRIVEDAFRQAVQKYGVPEAVYFDNGKQYRTKWMARTCSKLGTRLVFAKPYSPESKGYGKLYIMQSNGYNPWVFRAFTVH